MNDVTLIQKLRHCKNGMFIIPLRTDEDHVYALWDEHVSRRARRNLRFTLTVARNGMVANIQPRPGLKRQRRDATVAAVLFVLALLFVLSAFHAAAVRPLPAAPVTLEDRHECIRDLGEECPL